MAEERYTLDEARRELEFAVPVAYERPAPGQDAMLAIDLHAMTGKLYEAIEQMLFGWRRPPLDTAQR